MATASNLRIAPGEIPEEGLALEGRLDRCVFDLHENAAQPISDLDYRLRAHRVDDHLILSGALWASFSLECVRTLKRFPYEIRLDPYEETVEIENRAVIDLTERLREDILLALPAYPHSPESEAEELFPSVDGAPPAEPESNRSVWDALDGIPKNHDH